MSHNLLSVAFYYLVYLDHQSQKITYCMIPFIWYFQKDKPIVIVNRSVAAKGRGGCDYKGIAQRAFGGDGPVLFPNSSGCYINLSVC